MKKLAMVVASLLAASAFAGDALALDTRAGAYGGTDVEITTHTAFGDQLVGFSDGIEALGPADSPIGGTACAYGMIWSDPNSLLGGPSQPCLMFESLAPGGCGANALRNVAATVVALDVECGGYNAAGTVFPAGAGTGVTLILSEDQDVLGVGALEGVAVYPGLIFRPITL